MILACFSSHSALHGPSTVTELLVIENVHIIYSYIMYY